MELLSKLDQNFTISSNQEGIIPATHIKYDDGRSTRVVPILSINKISYIGASLEIQGTDASGSIRLPLFINAGGGNTVKYSGKTSSSNNLYDTIVVTGTCGATINGKLIIFNLNDL